MISNKKGDIFPEAKDYAKAIGEYGRRVGIKIYDNVSILGKSYRIEFINDNESDDAGSVDVYNKNIVINEGISIDVDNETEVLCEVVKETITHEVIHAFFHESGLSHYRDDEILVEWMAMQLPKIIDVVDEITYYNKE